MVRGAPNRTGIRILRHTFWTKMKMKLDGRPEQGPHMHRYIPHRSRFTRSNFLWLNWIEFVNTLIIAIRLTLTEGHVVGVTYKFVTQKICLIALLKFNLQENSWRIHYKSSGSNKTYVNAKWEDEPLKCIKILALKIEKYT